MFGLADTEGGFSSHENNHYILFLAMNSEKCLLYSTFLGLRPHFGIYVLFWD